MALEYVHAPTNDIHWLGIIGRCQRKSPKKLSPIIIEPKTFFFMLGVFMSVISWKNIRSLIIVAPRIIERSDKLWLLPADAFNTIKTGE
jgi:hypothetical protein